MRRSRVNIRNHINTHIVGVVTTLQESSVRRHITNILWADTESESLQLFHFLFIILAEESQIVLVIDFTSVCTLRVNNVSARIRERL